MNGPPRYYVWGHKIDSDIEKAMCACLACKKIRSEPVKTPVHPWIFPSKPLSCIYVDFLGLFLVIRGSGCLQQVSRSC